MTSLTPVTINVPDDLVLEFQDAALELLARLRAGHPPFPTATPSTPDSSSFTPLDAAQARPLDVHALPQWGTEDSDQDRAGWVLNDLHPDQVGIVASMARHAGERISGDAIAAETRYDGPRSVAPAMRGLAQRCRRVYRRPFWEFHRDATTGPGRYEMPEHVAELFVPALDEVRPDWRVAA